MVVFLVGNVMRTSASIFGLSGRILAAGPTYYELFQMLVGLVWLAIRILMVAGYQRTDAWARSNSLHAFGTRWTDASIQNVRQDLDS
jgi:hypothetical protein